MVRTNRAERYRPPTWAPAVSSARARDASRAGDRFRVSPRAVRVLALVAVIFSSILMLSGAGVRLSGSGLGCTDWPSCFQHRVTATLSFHPMVELVNRLVIIVVSATSIAALLAAALRSPRRRDLVQLGGAIVGGLATEIVVGGLVVLSKLNPYLVALHPLGWSARLSRRG